MPVVRQDDIQVTILINIPQGDAPGVPSVSQERIVPVQEEAAAPVTDEQHGSGAFPVNGASTCDQDQVQLSVPVKVPHGDLRRRCGHVNRTGVGEIFSAGIVKQHLNLCFFGVYLNLSANHQIQMSVVVDIGHRQGKCVLGATRKN